ncbi:(R)-mandelonitrile lyase [Uliginosibacterium aquaticum]|uniref:(R)-mandelonitrile lyase n=1 Tax=Uliginosibacterium aquaticum TaxID=2731212 RepID=UPI001C2D1B6D|nr:carboxymuconolactone decarboxylase family protein [Uliginosibacterium aquaticum]
MDSKLLPRLLASALTGLLALPASAAEAQEKVTALSVPVTAEAQRPGSIGPAERFTGKVSVAPLFAAEGTSRVSAAHVTFEPAARTAWHSHPVGQHLHVIRGAGYVQFWGGERRKITQGDVVWIPPGQKHWHGATQEASMTHLSVQEHEAGETAVWMEKVSDAQYGIAPAPTTPAAPQISRAQQLMGATAPKLAELTDQLLYADIWERPELSKRDRSLITVSALLAMNRSDQLRSHLALAQLNGVSRTELSELITHLAFYAGWPSAVSATSVAKEVFQNTPAPAAR